ncbi:urease accessory protein UreF [Paramesorhizobium deserti]|uniref:Urease accessory protein UreF n=1 Tax=Paramesorhizobium deserti TaxID=1494590 RepID=A0A135HTP5_9HYPH|nr:urease accessory protein UreF [Paramesorhizobium deserti]KXF76562.1 urease accessory protein UreF [Paramesorhizobium deserti]
MSDLTRLLQLLQFSDSALPVGAFTFSNGLESAIQKGAVHDAASLREFVFTAVRQAATLDGIALLTAHRAAQAADVRSIVATDHAAYQRRLNEEMRTMTVRMGKKLGELGEHLVGTGLLADWNAMIRSGATPGTFPIGFALVTSGFGIDARQAFAAHQYGVASMILGAALRLMRITFLETQAILLEVNAAIEEIYEEIHTDTLDDMRSFAPVADILAAVHLKAHLRMFMN